MFSRHFLEVSLSDECSENLALYDAIAHRFVYVSLHVHFVKPDVQMAQLSQTFINSTHTSMVVVVGAPVMGKEDMECSVERRCPL